VVIGPNGSFTGTFDGGGNTITNLSLTDEPALFAAIGTGGLVTNLTLSNLSVTNGFGGLTRTNGGTIQNVQVDGIVTLGASAGMIAGSSSGVVRDSSASGTLTAANHVGGLVGSNSGTIERCSSTVAVTAGNRVGGLVGTLEAGLIKESFATGTVNASLFAGGLVGTMRGGAVITDSYSRTSTINVTTTGGGLVGNIESGTGNTITNSYSANRVIATTTAGGITGEASVTPVVTSSYFDTSLYPTSPVGTGLSHAQMQVQASYVGWTFPTTWKFDSLISIFPALAWQ
jgi:hypothetical protein